MDSSIRSIALLLGAGLVQASAADDFPAKPSTAAPAQAEQAEAAFLEQYAATYRFGLGEPRAIQPAPDGKSILFLRSGPRSFANDLYELDLAEGRERVILRAESLLEGADEKLTPQEQARRERKRLVARGIAAFALSKDGNRILVPLSGRLFVHERTTGEVREIAKGSGAPIDPRFSPDGSRVAYVRNGELHVFDLDAGKERRLTSGAGGTVSHGLAEFVAQEEMKRHEGYWWSPDSKRLAYQRTDTAGVETLSIADAARPERAPLRWPYPRPGKRNAEVRLGIVDADGGETRWVEWDRDRFEYLAAVRWDDGAPLTILLQNRRQTEMRLLAVDVDDGATRTLVTERDDAWVEIDPTVPRWLPDGSAFLWTTERDGPLRLELRNRDGSPRFTVAPDDIGFQKLLGYLPSSREVFVLASADPTESHVYRMPLDPSRGAPVRLSREPGVHELIANEPGSLWVHRVSPRSGPPRYDVLAGGRPAGTIRSVAESPPFEARVELTTVGSDPVFRAALIRPRDFDASRAYPVIVHVYGGPSAQMVRADGRPYLLDQWMADRGYVVVRIDGRGTPHRGRDWSRAVKHDLIRIPLEDHARALRLLGERYDELDLGRVGIYGWSFGGYFAAMAVSREPELFRVGVAGAPVTDWMDYDTHYTERYMDLPENNPDGYRAASVLTYADRLSRPLLIIHGTSDDNVYFMHSLKLADALFRAGKRFDFLPLSGFTHMVPEPLVIRRVYATITDHFDRHLKR